MKNAPQPSDDWEVVHPGDARTARPAIIRGRYLKILVDCGECFGDPLPVARLIAAAPKMLAALKAVLAMTGIEREYGGVADDLVKKAVAMAEGENGA